MARNCHNAPKKQWKKWAGRPQAMFNRLWFSIRPEMMYCLGAKGMTRREMNVLRWNICWMAADNERGLDEDQALGWFDKKAVKR